MPLLKLLIEKTCRIDDASPHHCSLGCENLNQVGAAAECKLWGDLTWDEQMNAPKRLVPCVTAEYQHKRLQELNEIVQAAPVAYACAFPSDEFKVILFGITGIESKISVIKEIREILHLDLIQGKKLVEMACSSTVGFVLKDGLDKADAEKLKNKLQACGALVRIEQV